mmetsp:Transcript_45741/g.71565  ORF Transcript_45741/g.71565 Transcript_45741/m.71565 type:complete len:224 (-) Transcript_45741:195-866(-)
MYPRLNSRQISFASLILGMRSRISLSRASMACFSSSSLLRANSSGIWGMLPRVSGTAVPSAIACCRSASHFAFSSSNWRMRSSKSRCCSASFSFRAFWYSSTAASAVGSSTPSGFLPACRKRSSSPPMATRSYGCSARSSPSASLAPFTSVSPLPLMITTWSFSSPRRSTTQWSFTTARAMGLMSPPGPKAVRSLSRMYMKRLERKGSSSRLMKCGSVVSLSK